MSEVILTPAHEDDSRRLIRGLAARPFPNVAATPTSERRPGRRREEFAVLFCLVLVLCAELMLVRVGLDAADEGYFIEQATRVVRGQLPYRDFDSLYTPALLYVHAAILPVFLGSPLVDLRTVGLLARLVLAGGLYLVCRPLVRPAIAWLPSLYVLVALDRVPATWEPHPGWPSAALTIVAVWAYARLPSTNGFRRNVLLAAIGACAALVFAFKQNAGVLLGLALVVSTAWIGIEGTGTQVTRGLRRVQLLLLIVVIVTTMWLVHPHASWSTLAYFLVPLIAAGVSAILPAHVSGTRRGVGSWLGVLGWLGLGWSVVSLPWLIALLAALNWNFVLLKGFIGAASQDGLWYPLHAPGGGAWASLLGVGVGLLALVRCRRPPLLCGGAVLVVLAFGVSMIILTAEGGESVVRSLVLAPGRAADGVALFLPVVCIVAGAVLSFRPLPSGTAWWLRWMTVASALTFLTEYPRVDDVHLMWSAGLPLATGVVVLPRLYTHLTGRWSATGASRYLLATALVVVPIAAGLRNLGIRSQGFVGLLDPGAQPVELTSNATLMGPPAVIGMVVSNKQARTLIAAAQFVAVNTTPGEAIFVYPTSPLVYVLADRRNETRFTHLYPGAASPAELNGVIATLDQIPINVVVVSESDLAFWGPPGENAPLEAYLVDNYHQIARFGEYLVLHRD
jgi:hypothetical protein